jgi:hypothetical protein
MRKEIDLTRRDERETFYKGIKRTGIKNKFDGER